MSEALPPLFLFFVVDGFLSEVYNGATMEFIPSQKDFFFFFFVPRKHREVLE